MSKDTKNLLKEARGLLDKKEFLTVIKICKKILKEDKCNYHALVFMAAALRESPDSKSQACKSLKKAIAIQPNNPTAWHGLLACYKEESDIESLKELVLVYNQLLQIEIDSSKFTEYLKNISSYLLRVNNDDLLSQSIIVLCQLREKNALSKDLVKQINETIAIVLTQYNKLPHQYNEILEEVLSYFINDEDSRHRHEYYKKYLKLLYKTEKFNKLVTEAVKMHAIFNQDIYPLEWLCRVYSELIITCGKKIEEIDITAYYELLLDHDSISTLGYLAKAVHFYETKNFIDARNITNHLVNIKPKWFHAWLLLSKIDIMIYCWEDAVIATSNAQKLIPEGDPHNLLQTINLLLLEALIKSSNFSNWKKAEAQFDTLSDDSTKSITLKAHLYVLLRDSRAKDLISNLKKQPETSFTATILHAMDLLEERQLDEAADVLGSILETSEAWLIFGKIYWEMSDFKHSFMAFLQGIKADPNNWECLVYIGRYHQEHTNDYERSKKCYQKALQINPNSEEAGIGLSLVHRVLKNTEENLHFLTQLTSQGRGPKWALIQLGLLHLDHENFAEAVSVLRNAVKTDPFDSNCWECLADSYLSRGAYLSALRTYERALQLNPESYYSMTQLANIKLLVGHYKLAIEDFLNILQKNECNVSALKGLAECYFEIGKEHAAAQLLGRARDNFQEAVDYLSKAIMYQSNFLCNWKLLADVCHSIAQLPNKYCVLKVIPELVWSDNVEKIEISLSECLLLAIRCYCMALKLSKKSPLLWYDLARCYLTQLQLDSSVDRKVVVNKSFAAVKEAVKLDPHSWFNWNLLGVICMLDEIKNYALAQHSFVLAIEKESNNPVSWTNLGSLYLLLENQYRANKAFSWAQKIDPAYINCWIGQAFIAETSEPKEALDLFRHSTQLGYHHEAATGYTHWVLKTMMDPNSKNDPHYTYAIEKMHAVTKASDEIQWFTVHYPNNIHALNAYGLLLERQKLYKSSTRMFSNALIYAKGDHQKDLLKGNLARVMLQQGNYDSAIEICESISTKTFLSHCQIALSLFKAERYDESYKKYEEALNFSNVRETEKAHVLCAMAAMAYMFQDSETARTLLYQSINFEPPTISGLLALSALGMLDNDENLTRLVLKEFKDKHYDDDPKYRNHIAKLMAYSYLIQNDKESASRVLCKFVHRYADSTELWTNLARVLFEISDMNFNKCVSKALFLGRGSSNEHIAKITCMSSLSKLITSNQTEGLRSILNTVHSFPADVNSWSNFIMALVPRWSRCSKFNAHWLMLLTSKIRNDFMCTRNMEQWLLRNEKFISDIASH